MSFATLKLRSVRWKGPFSFRFWMYMALGGTLGLAGIVFGYTLFAKSWLKPEKTHGLPAKSFQP